VSIPEDLDRRFRERAAAEGLLDVAFDTLDSPVGHLVVAATEAGVCTISWREQEAVVDELASIFGARVLRSSRPVAPALRQLDEYFEGRRHTFELPVDIAVLPAFQQRVLEELARVPYGELATYGGLAARVGKPRGARAVGGALNRNPIPIVLPCHRIVGASGNLVGYAGGLERKRMLLELEGSLLSVDS
jgi:methylated-DNA-[protein]-cysteine S-methyltransferase